MEEQVLEKIVCFAIQLKEGYGLPPESQSHLHQLAERVILGRERFLASEQINLFDPYDKFSKIPEDLIASPPHQFVAVVNHFSRCPLGIVGNAIFVAHELRKATNIEPYIIQGVGRSVISLLRENINRTTNIILVGGSNGSSEEIKRTLKDGKSFIFYPEGKNSTDLKQGNFKAGRVLLNSARENIPLLPIGFYFKNNCFNLQMGNLLDQAHILELGDNQDKKQSGQAIADYAMRKIATLLPDEHHGFYNI